MDSQSLQRGDASPAATAIEQGPIIIGGLDRSGKTLLRALLVSHPRIAAI